MIYNYFAPLSYLNKIALILRFGKYKRYVLKYKYSFHPTLVGGGSCVIQY